MSEFFNRIALITRELAILATASRTPEEHDACIQASAVTVPDLAFSWIQHEMAFDYGGLEENRAVFQPLTGEMRINGILVKPADR